MPVRTLFLILIIIGASVAYAAPEKSAAEAPETPAAEFSKLNAQFRELVAQLKQLRRRYQNDPSGDKENLQAEWQVKIKQIKQIESKMAVSAEKAYAAAPDSSNRESEFLFAHLAGLVKADNYEESVRMVKMLAGLGYEHQYFNLVAGLSFFATMDFAEAKKYLVLAKEQNEIDETGKRYLNQIERHNYPELWKKEQALRAAEDEASNLPKVKLATTKGDIVVALFEDQAPIATANFIELVEKKYFDGLKFHRVIQGFMAQGGDPKGDGTGGPGYTIPDECYEDDHRNHFRGSLSMANSGRDTGGSQFFLTFVPTAHLDGKHTVFGRVVEGMDVLSKLQRCEPGDASTADRITRATVLSKRNHRYVNVKRADKK